MLSSPASFPMDRMTRRTFWKLTQTTGILILLSGFALTAWQLASVQKDDKRSLALIGGGVIMFIVGLIIYGFGRVSAWLDSD